MNDVTTKIRNVIRAFERLPHNVKREPEYYAMRVLRLVLNRSPKEQQAAILIAYDCFGAPGDWGYGTPEAEVLSELYLAIE